MDRVGASLGLYSSTRGGRRGHPSVVPKYTKDHLKSIIFFPPDWPGNDTTQRILGIMVHHQRVTSSSLRWCPQPKNPNKLLPTPSEIWTQCGNHLEKTRAPLDLERLSIENRSCVFLNVPNLTSKGMFIDIPKTGLLPSVTLYSLVLQMCMCNSLVECRVCGAL